MRPKKALLIMTVLGVIGLLIMFLSSAGESLNMALMVIGFCFVFAGLIINFKFWRCSSCGRILPSAHFGMEYCPYCGEWID